MDWRNIRSALIGLLKLLRHTPLQIVELRFLDHANPPDSLNIEFNLDVASVSPQAYQRPATAIALSFFAAQSRSGM